MKNYYVLVCSAVLLGLPWLLPGNPHRDRADHLVRSNRYEEAISYYRRYLDSGQSQTDFADVLLKASMLETDVQKGLNLLLLYDKKMPTPQQRREVFQRIAILQEYLSNAAAASAAYQVAFENSYPPDYQLYLRVGFLSLDTGDVEKALAVSSVLLANVKAADIRISAINLALLAYASIQDLDRGLALIGKEKVFIDRSALASYYYALYRFYRANDEKEEAQRAKEYIVINYPKSAEAMLVQRKARPWPSPLNLFF